MRGVWLAIAIGFIAGVGCTSTPKREMKQPIVEELPNLPEGAYTTPPDYTRDQPVLTPKAGGPGMTTPQVPGLGGPTGPGSPGAAGARR